MRAPSCILAVASSSNVEAQSFRGLAVARLLKTVYLLPSTFEVMEGRFIQPWSALFLLSLGVGFCGAAAFAALHRYGLVTGHGKLVAARRGHLYAGWRQGDTEQGKE